MPDLEFRRAGNYEEALLFAADECSVDREYWDIFHRRHEPSADVRRRILQSLGWDVSSFDAIEREREKRFLQNAAAPLSRTLVISESDKSVPLILELPSGDSISFQISVENGEHLGGSLESCQLGRTGQVVFGDRRWTVFRLPLPAELPLGYHSISITINGRGAGQSALIVCPDRAYLPQNLQDGGKTAGFNVTLYGLRSDRNWGCGDFTDLRKLLDWARHDAGFSLIGLNPLHALHNRVPYNTSPYLPLSLYYKNLIYIDVESVPEFRSSSCAQGLFKSPKTQEKLRALRDSEFVAYREVDRLKRRFLKLLYREFRRASDKGRARAFATFCAREGELLHKFALYCALDEILHKQDRNRWTWLQWPEEYRSPDSDATKEFAQKHWRTVEFYKYIQFVVDEQLAAAQHHARQIGMPIGLYHDLAVATDSCGSDLWAYGSFYVRGCRVGAPPDDFSPEGQDWAFPPPHAGVHRDDGYRLYRESIRKIVEHGGALRIDHVMRLFRLFWIPDGVSAANGIYVRDNATELMRILALESVRSRNIIIGEDLGTVTDQIREMLAHFGVLSYRLFYFEKNRPDQSFKHSADYPRQALVSSTTHDLPTITGFWSYRDIEARRAAGLADENGYWSQIEDRKRDKQRLLNVLHSEHLLPDHYPRDVEHVREVDGELHNAIVGFLAQVPSMILLLNQEDFTKETEQQNLPGSTAQYPNWQRKMRVKVEDLGSAACAPYAAMIRSQLDRSGRRLF